MINHFESLTEFDFEKVNFLISGFYFSEVLELELESDLDLESEELPELLSDDIAVVELKKRSETNEGACHYVNVC